MRSSEIGDVSSTASKALKIIDMGLLLGAKGPCYDFLTATASKIHPLTRPRDCPPIFKTERVLSMKSRVPFKSNEKFRLAIKVLKSPPDLTLFSQILDENEPVLLKNCIADWPALSKWKSLDYLSQVGGRRSVPVEIGEFSSNFISSGFKKDFFYFVFVFLGSSYLDDGAGSKIMTLDSFIDTCICDRSEGSTPGYLAQHCLFDQIIDLKRDFYIPDYCSLLTDSDESARCPDCDPDDVVVNSWFGPVGCSSPLHHDPYHNLLAQVHRCMIMNLIIYI